MPSADVTRRPGPASNGRIIGTRVPRVEGRAKVTGATRYAADQPVPGVLAARIVPSLYAHARIGSIDASAALALPGVRAVLTAADLPIVGRGVERRYEPLVVEEAVFAGQPVALVVADTDAIAEDAAALVRVDARPVPPVVDALAAIDDGAPLARLRPRPTESEAPASNLHTRERTVEGDAEAALATSEIVVEGAFSAPWVHQAYMEPQAGTAWLEPDGTLVVSSGTQATFHVRNELAAIYGLPSSMVRVIPATLGGGFGGKEMLIEPLLAGAALRLRRPVRLTLTRSEDFAGANPSQGLRIDVRIGARRSGRFEALTARLTYDAGAYPEESWEWFAPALMSGPYRWPALDIEAIGVVTNRFGTGNYRAPTGPPGIFALEASIDLLAERAGLDPIEVRRMNLVHEGDEDTSGDAWPRIGAPECLDRLADHPLWTRRGELPRGEGVGLALGVWPGTKVPASALCRVEADGRLRVVTGVVDISGTSTTMAAVAAEAFGVPIDQVAIVTADTSTAPYSPWTAASAITYGLGPAVHAAALEARDRVLRFAADEFEIDAGDLEIVDGWVRPIGAPERGRILAEVVSAFDDFASPHPPLEGHASTAHTVKAPSASGHLAHVRVDRETGVIALLDYVVIQDVGRALNPALVEGQMHGGAVQSIGRALWEALVHDDQGQLVTGSFLDYAVPRAPMLPAIETIILEVPAPEGPHGAKGIGESSALGAPAAIANAIAAAVDVRLHELPMTSRRVWTALRAADPPADPDRGR